MEANMTITKEALCTQGKVQVLIICLTVVPECMMWLHLFQSAGHAASKRNTLRTGRSCETKMQGCLRFSPSA